MGREGRGDFGPMLAVRCTGYDRAAPDPLPLVEGSGCDPAVGSLECVERVSERVEEGGDRDEAGCCAGEGTIQGVSPSLWCACECSDRDGQTEAKSSERVWRWVGDFLAALRETVRDRGDSPEGTGV